MHTGRTNGLVEEALLAGRIPALRGYPVLRREVRFGERSRVDILLERGDEKVFVEVKNVTYKVGKRALFPDAVTERGARHLRELAGMVSQGHRAVIFYLINRDDCTSMGPAREIDPVYGRTLDEAMAAGVEALAYRAKNTLDGAVVERKIPIRG